jgi:tripartite-type tricarboxylate transporter receptor subunit TctC
MISFNRRAVAAAAALAFGATLSSFAMADPSFPNKPITLIVPWPAGGSSDLTIRAMADAASKHLGQPIIVDNKAGASGTLGPATMAAAAKPDGYTLSQMPISVVRIPVMQKASFDTLKDFTYILQLTGYTFGITTKADSDFKSWADVVAFAKANPGKVTYATPGVGTSLHIGVEMMAAKDGIKLTHVPFKGGAETNAAVLGGHTMLQADSTAWKPLVDAKQLRLLTIWTGERSKQWPEAPTLKEIGHDMVLDSPFGLAGPKGMDPVVVKKLHDAFEKALKDPAAIDMLNKYDMFPRYLGTADYVKAMEGMVKVETLAIKELGLARKD